MVTVGDDSLERPHFNSTQKNCMQILEVIVDEAWEHRDGRSSLIQPSDIVVSISSNVISTDLLHVAIVSYVVVDQTASVRS
jgi:hypothetical protein